MSDDKRFEWRDGAGELRWLVVADERGHSFSPTPADLIAAGYVPVAALEEAKVEVEALRIGLTGTTKSLQDVRDVLGDLLETSRPGGGAATIAQLLLMLRAAWRENLQTHEEQLQTNAEQAEKLRDVTAENEHLQGVHHRFSLELTFLKELEDDCRLMAAAGNTQRRYFTASLAKLDALRATKDSRGGEGTTMVDRSSYDKGVYDAMHGQLPDYSCGFPNCERCKDPRAAGEGKPDLTVRCDCGETLPIHHQCVPTSLWTSKAPLGRCIHLRAWTDEHTRATWCPDCGAVRFGPPPEFAYMRPRAEFKRFAESVGTPETTILAGAPAAEAPRETEPAPLPPRARAHRAEERDWATGWQTHTKCPQCQNENRQWQDNLKHPHGFLLCIHPWHYLDPAAEPPPPSNTGEREGTGEWVPKVGEPVRVRLKGSFYFGQLGKVDAENIADSEFGVRVVLANGEGRRFSVSSLEPAPQPPATELPVYDPSGKVCGFRTTGIPAECRLPPRHESDHVLHVPGPSTHVPLTEQASEPSSSTGKEVAPECPDRNWSVQGCRNCGADGWDNCSPQTRRLLRVELLKALDAAIAAAEPGHAAGFKAMREALK